jgi:hypothetical protein
VLGVRGNEWITLFLEKKRSPNPAKGDVLLENFTAVSLQQVTLPEAHLHSKGNNYIQILYISAESYLPTLLNHTPY